VGVHFAKALRAQGFSVTIDCGSSSAPQIRTTLYFGLSRPKGSVSELEWQIFLRDEATKRFPDGLTVVDNGLHRLPRRRCIGMNQQQHLRLLAIDAANGYQPLALRLPHAYGDTFDQQSVLWESARVCVAG
jgi:hypothetical protein